MSVQYGNPESQKFTRPVFTAAPPFVATTVAVSVITLPVLTVVTAPAPDVSARVVVVAEFAANIGCVLLKIEITRANENHKDQLSFLTFTEFLHSSVLWTGRLNSAVSGLAQRRDALFLRSA